MEVLSRTDEKVKVTEGEINITEKYMANGEVRKRVKYPGGTSFSLTKAADWKPEDGLPWQDAHCHKGLTEVYTLLSGIIVFIHRKDIKQSKFSMDWLNVPGQTIAFNPLNYHVVLLGPNAVISTQLFGSGVPNSNRKNNDWWPADENFMKEAKDFGEFFLNKYRLL